MPQREPLIGIQLEFLRLGWRIVATTTKQFLRAKHAQLRLLERLALLPVIVQLFLHAACRVLTRRRALSQVIDHFPFLSHPRSTRFGVNRHEMTDIVPDDGLTDLQGRIRLQLRVMFREFLRNVGSDQVLDGFVCLLSPEQCLVVIIPQQRH